VGKELVGRPAMSVRVHIVTEGQTETNFVKKVLVPYFSDRGITLVPCTLVTKNDKKAGRQYKGDIAGYSRAKNDITKFMASARKNREIYVSTFFDFYRLPNDFPGFDGAQKINDPYSKVEFLEKSLQDDIDKNGASFLPYLSLYEFEALLFSDIHVVKDYFFEKDMAPLVNREPEYFNPELVNNGEKTSPSKRILQCVPEYNKPVDGVAIAQKIGLDVIRKKCRHFDGWIKKLEGLRP
jgi:hypothetical protein